MSRPEKGAVARSAARLAVVQALYQTELTGGDISHVAAEFIAHRMGAATEDLDLSSADQSFFRDLLFGVVRRQIEIDNLIAEGLAAGWSLARLDSILRALLRAAVYELTARSDVPARAVINEYVEVAHAFFQGDEPGFVNGVLDRLARALRGAEFRSGETAS